MYGRAKLEQVYNLSKVTELEAVEPESQPQSIWPQEFT